MWIRINDESTVNTDMLSYICKEQRKQEGGVYSPVLIGVHEDNSTSTIASGAINCLIAFEQIMTALAKGDQIVDIRKKDNKQEEK